MGFLSRSLFIRLILQSEATAPSFHVPLAVILNLLDSPTPLLYNADSGIRVKSGTVNDPMKLHASRTVNSSCGEQRRFTAHGRSLSRGIYCRTEISMGFLSRSLSSRLIYSLS